VIRQLTKAIQIPVIVLSQLNRAYAGRASPKPTMADVRGSGTIEANSNNIMAIYRDEQHNADSEDIGVAELIILKQREGQTGTIRLAFDGPTTTFRNLLRAA
jgi:replicative DNA helicase